MTKTILVTGATGKIGGQLVPRLLARGLDVRAFVRDAAKAKALADAGAKLAVGDLEQPETLTPALAGVDTVVLITAPGPKAFDLASSAIDRIKAAGVRKVVRISVLMPDAERPTDNVRQHGLTDDKLVASGLTYTILRPNFFMQNVFMSAPTIAKDGKMYWGMGDGKLAMIDVRDIVESAEAACVSDAHDNQIIPLCGPAAITFGDIAKEVSTALGREITYVAIPPEAVAASLREMGAGEWAASVMADYSRAYSRGWGNVTSDGVRRLTGKPARSIHDFVTEQLAPALRR